VLADVLLGQRSDIGQRGSAALAKSLGGLLTGPNEIALELQRDPLT